MGGAFAPQIPALVFSLAKSANFGPWLLDVDVCLIPAPALAVDHSEPKASPPVEAFDCPVLFNEGIELEGALAPEVEG